MVRFELSFHDQNTNEVDIINMGTFIMLRFETGFNDWNNDEGDIIKKLPSGYIYHGKDRTRFSGSQH